MTVKKQKINLKLQQQRNNLSANIISNELLVDTQEKLVSGTLGFIVDNSNIIINNSNIISGTVPIFTLNNSNIETVKSNFNKDNINVSSDFYKVATLLNNNNLTIDNIINHPSSQFYNKITRPASYDNYNLVDFPSPSISIKNTFNQFNNKTAVDINTNEDINSIYGAGDINNDGLLTFISSPSTSIMLQDLELDMTLNTNITYFNTNITDNISTLNSFINSLPRNLNNHKIKLIVNNVIDSYNNIIFNDFYGGVIEISSKSDNDSSSIAITFNNCSNVLINDAKLSNIIINQCDNVIINVSHCYGNISINECNVHMFNSELVNPTGFIKSIINSQCLIENCYYIKNNNKIKLSSTYNLLKTTSVASQISIIDNENSSLEMMNKNWFDNTGLVNHYHINLEKSSSDNPPGTIYAWPRGYSRRMLVNSIRQKCSSLDHVGKAASMNSYSTLYLPAYDIPLDTNDHLSTHYLRNYREFLSLNGKTEENIYPNLYITPDNLISSNLSLLSGMNTYEPRSYFTSLDWYGLKNQILPSGTPFAYSSKGFTDVFNELSSDTKCISSQLTKLSGCITVDTGVTIELTSVDVGNVKSREDAKTSITLSMNANTGKVLSTLSASKHNDNASVNTIYKYKIDLTDLMNYINPELYQYVKITYKELDNIKTYKVVDLQHVKNNITTYYIESEITTTGINSTFVLLSKFCIYVPFITADGRIRSEQIAVIDRFANSRTEIKNGHAKYEYDMPKIALSNFTTHLKLISTPTTNKNINQDDWYTFSDIILTIKGAFSNKIEYSYSDPALLTPISGIVTNTNYYFSAKYGDTHILYNMFTPYDETQYLNNSLSAYTGNNEETINYSIGAVNKLHWEITPHIENYDLTCISNSNSNKTTLYNSNKYVAQSFNLLLSPYITNLKIDNGNNLTVMPIQLATSSVINNISNIALSSICLDTINNKFFRFNDQILLGKVRKNLAKSAETFLDITHGQIVNSHIKCRGKDAISADASIISTNLMLYNQVSSIVAGTIGQAAPLYASNIEGDALTVFNNIPAVTNDFEFMSIPLPLSTTITKFNRNPVYYGIPYVVHDQFNFYMTDINENIISADICNLGAVDKFGTLQTSYNLNNIPTSSIIDEDTDLQVFSLKPFMDEFSNISDLKYSTDISNYTFVYSRTFSFNESNNGAGTGTISYGTLNNGVLTEINKINWNTAVEGDFKQSFSNVLNNSTLYTNNNNSYIKIDYVPEISAETLSTSVIYTNIGTFNENQIKYIEIEDHSFNGYYDTKMSFNCFWEFKSFCIQYMSKLNYVANKLAILYKTYISNANGISSANAVSTKIKNTQLLASFSALTNVIGFNTFFSRKNEDYNKPNFNINVFDSDHINAMPRRYLYTGGRYLEGIGKLTASTLTSSYINENNQTITNNYGTYYTLNSGYSSAPSTELTIITSGYLYPDLNHWATNSYDCASIYTSPKQLYNNK